ncbi:MAG TPA: hypothetical protein VEW69_02875 [Alphaproteobacteria bacterium]|nr:hypothetical protein [Alphaproteobacteria bacterium]
MREPEPQSDDRLTRALRQMGAASSQGAPPELGQRLAQSFRRHHQRRRTLRMSLSAAAACLCVAISFLLIAKYSNTSLTAKTPPTTVLPAGGTKHILGQDDGFFALTVFDSGTEMEDLRLVRVEMPGSALRLVGAPVSEDLAGQRITADLVVGQDGTPYAIRLVQ